jgi:hypothetical protein
MYVFGRLCWTKAAMVAALLLSTTFISVRFDRNVDSALVFSGWQVWWE